MLFYNPVTKKFSTSADYKLDLERSLPDVFPDLVYDGTFTSRRLSDGSSVKEAFPPGSHVFARILEEFYEGYVNKVPTDEHPWYSVQPLDGGAPFAVDPLEISGPDDPLYPRDEYRDDPTARVLLPWIKNNGKITLFVDGFLRPGRLQLSSSHLWEFIQRDSCHRVSFRYNLHDLPSTWRVRLFEGGIKEG